VICNTEQILLNTAALTAQDVTASTSPPHHGCCCKTPDVNKSSHTLIKHCCTF